MHWRLNKKLGLDYLAATQLMRTKQRNPDPYLDSSHAAGMQLWKKKTEAFETLSIQSILVVCIKDKTILNILLELWTTANKGI